MPTSVKRNSRKASKNSLQKNSQDIVINDENWKCIVCMLVESEKDQMLFTEMLNESCRNGYRKAIRLISRKEILSYRYEIIKSDPLFTESSHHSFETIEQNEEIPVLHEASLIKRMIYELRLEYLARKSAELEFENERKQALLAMQELCPDERPSSKKKQQEVTKKLDEFARKADSRLRKRGEEWRDHVWIDDAPIDGPDLYILLTGFHSSKLPVELIRSKVPLNSIFRLEILSLDGNSEELLQSPADSKVLSSSTTSHLTSTLKTNQNSSPENFWTNFDESTCLDISILSFCIPSTCDNIYDRLSYALYDVHDLLEDHKAYLNSMKLIDPYEPRFETRLTKDLLVSVPEECITIMMILNSMLEHIEESFNSTGDEINDAESENEEHSSSSSSVAAAAFTRLTEKLYLLNLKYELISKKPQPAEASSRYELILHAVDSCLGNNDDGEKFQEIRITEARTRLENFQEVKKCRVHLPGIFECCKKENIHASSAEHYLNLLGFKKMLESYNDDAASKNSIENALQTNERDAGLNIKKNLTEIKRVNIMRNIGHPFESNLKKRCQSKLSNNFSKSKTGAENSSEQVLYSTLSSICDITSKTTSQSTPQPQINGPSIRLSSSSQIEVTSTELLNSFENCSSLLNLIDIYENLIPSKSTSKYKCLALEEFVYVEHHRTVSEIVDDYLVRIEHFAPTDSILLLVRNEQPCKMTKRNVTCILRTAVRFGDFVKYIVSEEYQWFERRRNLNKQNRWKMNRFSDDMGMIFKNEDFLLPGSLKAYQIQKMEEKVKVGEIVKNEEVMNSKKKNGKVSQISKDKIAKTSTHSLHTEFKKKEIPKTPPTNSECEPEISDYQIDFIGYDLAENGRRVQVSNLSRKYSTHDGFYLHFSRDYWLPTLQINVNVKIEFKNKFGERGSFCCHVDENMRNTFNLITTDGIVVAFEKIEEDYGEISGNRESSGLEYEIQISWPSSLIIKPMEYQDLDYPFYVLQYYISKGPSCESIKDETHRKYLYNGDVVKFLNDGSIIVLRPNGTLITIVNYKEGAENFSSMFPCNCRIFKEDIGLSRESSFNFEQSSLMEMKRLGLIVEVLELDGRRYEAIDAYIVRELDRSPVIWAEEYDHEEKFVRRADGTDALFTKDAELIINFPDGTRILSGCKIEDEPIQCDWTFEELERYFEENEKPEGFISVVTYSHVEHPNYASVYHDNGICCLSMTKSLNVQFRSGGLIEFTTCDNDVRVQLNDETVSIFRSPRNDCCCTSQVTFQLNNSSIVLVDGANRLTLRRDGSFDLIPMENVCDCNNQDMKFRLFAVNRNGEVQEYHHRSKWQELLNNLIEDENACLMRHPVENRSGAEYRLALMSANIGLARKGNWLLDYTIRKALPSPVLLVDLWDETFKASKVTGLKRFLKVRLLEGIASEAKAVAGTSDGNFLISMQRALVRYWKEIATGMHKRYEKDTKKMPVTCDCLGDMEKRMRDLALGKVKMIDFQSYEAGRQELRKMKVEQERMIDDDTQAVTNVFGWNNE